MLNHMRKCWKWLKSYTLYIPCQFNSPFLIFVWITFSYLYMCRVYIDWLVGTEKNIFYIHTRWHCVYVCVCGEIPIPMSHIIYPFKYTTQAFYNFSVRSFIATPPCVYHPCHLSAIADAAALLLKANQITF